MRKYGALGRGHKHSEAFCLMNYAHPDGEVEVLWNSRDGVTPFMVHSKDGSKTLTHIRWQDDVCVPDHVPAIGDRIFVDATPELVEPHVREFVAKYWNPGEETDAAMRDVYPSPEEAVSEIVEEWSSPGSPHIVTVTKELITAYGWEDKDLHDGSKTTGGIERLHPDG